MSETLRCPVCRAQVEQGPQCRRCRADLTLLFALEGQRQRLLVAAAQSLHQGRYQEALAMTEEVNALRTGEDVRRMRALCYLLQRDFAQAMSAAMPLLSAGGAPGIA